MYQTCVLVVPGVRFVLAYAGATLGRGRLVAIRTQVLADEQAAICCVIRQNIWREWFNDACYFSFVKDMCVGFCKLERWSPARPLLLSNVADAFCCRRPCALELES